MYMHAYNLKVHIHSRGTGLMIVYLYMCNTQHRRVCVCVEEIVACCSVVLQCGVAVCCSVLQCGIVVCCSVVLQCMKQEISAPERHGGDASSRHE